MCVINKKEEVINDSTYPWTDGLGFDMILVHLYYLPMLIKTHPLSFTFVRQKIQNQPKPLTKTQWISYDRVVMLLLIAMVIAGAVIYS